MMKEYYVVSKTTGMIINCVTSENSPDEIKARMPYDWDRYDLDPNPSHHKLMEYEFYTVRP